MMLKKKIREKVWAVFFQVFSSLFSRFFLCFPGFWSLFFLLYISDYPTVVSELLCGLLGVFAVVNIVFSSVIGRQEGCCVCEESIKVKEYGIWFWYVGVLTSFITGV